MTETRIIVVRHGETIWNIEGIWMGHMDSPLTPKGVVQAEYIATRLSEVKFELIYSSDLGRALQTAEHISIKCGKAIQKDARLRERNIGIFEGLTDSEISEKFPEERKKHKEPGNEYQIPKGESRAQRNERVVEFFEEIAKKHTGQTVVVVTHGGVLASIFQYSLGISYQPPQTFKRSNASYSLFTFSDSQWIIETWNDVSHLIDIGTMPDMNKS